MKRWNVAVIGGGPAGLMACVAAAQKGASVILIEKGNILGRKLMISGGGRCNVTNAKPVEEIIKNIPGNGKFLYSSFSQFNNENIIDFFEGMGIPLKEEDRGRMFPATDRAKTVVGALLRKIQELGVTIYTGNPVKDIQFSEKEHTLFLNSGEKIRSHAIVIATGGCSVPQTGSTGDGYIWAQKAGHTITELYPTAVPLKANDFYIIHHLLQGLSLREVSLTLLNPKGKKVAKEDGDMIFTHFGISGPTAFRISHYVSVTQKKYGKTPLHLTIDLRPNHSLDAIEKEVLEILRNNEKKSVKNALNSFIPDRLLFLLLEWLEVDDTMTTSHFSKEKIQKLIFYIKNFPVTITGTLPLEQATVTGGGVSIKEIDPKTMESRLMKGLYFAGEVMDVHAHTGGYNITVAFSTGFTAGSSAAEHIL